MGSVVVRPESAHAQAAQKRRNLHLWEAKPSPTQSLAPLRLSAIAQVTVASAVVRLGSARAQAAQRLMEPRSPTRLLCPRLLPR